MVLSLLKMQVINLFPSQLHISTIRLICCVVAQLSKENDDPGNVLIVTYEAVIGCILTVSVSLTLGVTPRRLMFLFTIRCLYCSNVSLLHRLHWPCIFSLQRYVNSSSNSTMTQVSCCVFSNCIACIVEPSCGNFNFVPALVDLSQMLQGYLNFFQTTIYTKLEQAFIQVALLQNTWPVSRVGQFQCSQNIFQRSSPSDFLVTD